ncbi:protein kinase domain-containing protein [Gordonia sp. DT219]|uniref:serine/threonine-protein kinase n=1 Tax=Gordonia sp. DT219 TaxID=3416658 RepID=UPI003CE7994A
MTADAESHRTPGPNFLVAGRYRLISRIGGGGMGTVWLARDQLLDREVAVKQVLSTEGLSEDSAETVRQRAMREGRIAARLSHRNAIAMHDVALDGGEPWLVMEYLPSRSIAQILHATGTVDVTEAAKIGAQVADAMVEAHASGIIHRDIKPGNILIAGGGRQAGLVKITDFGISRAKDDVTITQTGLITGTPAYFAPEVARGDPPAEPSDVYSLGATIYTMVEGQPPFGVDDNSLVMLHRVARAQINPMTKAGALEPVLLRMLEPSPKRRITMTQARDELARVVAGEHGSTEQVLTSLVSRSDLGLNPRRRPATPTGQPANPGTGGRGPHTKPPGPQYDPTRVATPAPYDPSTPSSAAPYSSAPYSSAPYSPAPYPQHYSSPSYSSAMPPLGPASQRQQTSPALLAVVVLLFFLVLAGVIVLVIALLS